MKTDKKKGEQTAHFAKRKKVEESSGKTLMERWLFGWPSFSVKSEMVRFWVLFSQGLGCFSQGQVAVSLVTLKEESLWR